jgi:predicted P-loop ATPase
MDDIAKSEKYIKDAKGKMLSCLYNARLLFKGQPSIKPVYDSFTRRHTWRGEPLDDRHILSEYTRLEASTGRGWAKQHVADAMLSLTYENSQDSLQEYLVGCVWEGVERVDTFLADHLGVPNDAWLTEVSRVFCLQMAARGMIPGAQADYVPLLFGPQGTGKSTLLRWLVPKPEWVMSGLAFASDDLRAMQQMAGKWIVEFGDLRGMKGADTDHLKDFLTRRADNYRAPYERMSRDYPRRVVFVATTNNESALQDETGNRRFLPVHVPHALNFGLQTDIYRDQLWAEAVHRVQSGESYVLKKELTREALDRQDAVRSEDAWEELLSDRLDASKKYSVMDIAKDILFPLAPSGYDYFQPARVTRGIEMKVAKCLVALGWTKCWDRKRRAWEKKLSGRQP